METELKGNEVASIKSALENIEKLVVEVGKMKSLLGDRNIVKAEQPITITPNQPSIDGNCVDVSKADLSSEKPLIWDCSGRDKQKMPKTRNKRKPSRDYMGWTWEEIRFLKENYSRRKIRGIAKALDRTPNAIRNKASILGLKKVCPSSICVSKPFHRTRTTSFVIPPNPTISAKILELYALHTECALTHETIAKIVFKDPTSYYDACKILIGKFLKDNQAVRNIICRYKMAEKLIPIDVENKVYQWVG
jgi:hypothetical protein